MRQKLQEIFEEKDWTNNSRGPRSGHGSTLRATKQLRAALPGVFARYDVKRFVDAPCGDWTWMQSVDLSGIDYLGGDIAPSLIRDNIENHKRDNVRFEILDITSTPLPPSDLFLCRECLFHLRFWLRWEFFKNFANSESRYLIMTIDHVNRNKNVAANAHFQRFDPRLPPFNLAEPIEIIPENYRTDSGETPETSKDPRKLRSSGVWTIDQIRQAVHDHFEKSEDPAPLPSS